MFIIATFFFVPLYSEAVCSNKFTVPFVMHSNAIRKGKRNKTRLKINLLSMWIGVGMPSFIIKIWERIYNGIEMSGKRSKNDLVSLSGLTFT